MNTTAITAPDLTTPYPVTKEMVRQYQENGHALCRGLASKDEIEFYRKAILDGVNKLNTERRKMEERDTYGKAFLQIFNLWRQNEVLKKFVLAKRFGQVAAQLMGVERVRLYHDQALFKEPGGGHTPWHQDQFYWPLDTNNTITMWMPLIDITQEMGIMNFASGTHKIGSIDAKEISDSSENFFNEFVKSNQFNVTGATSLSAGDATFHAGWTLHSAPGNNSPKMREVMTIIYFADNTKVLKPDHDHRKKDHEVWLMSIPPGELAASELNPVIE
ncbi:MAG TPA: phytanoyl-CoA dioxygenase family protein [Cyclobacteriaceae bacterium]|nr:phytanoyl-CoA dioxygenase family protein [Cyclobacteriaceae bacterium]